MQPIIGIYKIISPSGKIYIGQSKDIIKRWGFYKRLSCKGQTILYRSLLKHGFQNHKFEIIEECEVELLNNREKYYVDLFQTFNSKHGLNIKDGGGSKGKLAESTKLKISISNKGKIRSIDVKERISKSMIGIVFSKEHKENLSKKAIGNTNQKNINYKSTEMSDKLRKVFSIPIIQIKNSVIVKKWDSSKQAGKELGCNYKNINACVNGKRKQALGFTWKKANQEYNKK